MDENEDFDYLSYLSLRYVLGIGLVLALGYVSLLIKYPRVWAVVTGILIALTTGLFTTKIIFKFQNPWLVWGLAPVFGLIWIGFFWLFWLFQTLS